MIIAEQPIEDEEKAFKPLWQYIIRRQKLKKVIGSPNPLRYIEGTCFMLAQLVFQQMADSKSRHVSRDGRESVIDSRYLVVLADRQNREHITWGLPAQITQCRLDRQCPRCGALPTQVSYERSAVSIEKTRLAAGIEIKENMAFCVCGWSYEND